MCSGSNIMFKTPPKSTSSKPEMEQRIIAAFKQEMNSMKEEMRDLKNVITARDEKINSLEEELVTLKMDMTSVVSEVESLKKVNTSLKHKIDATEAYERRDTIIISGDIPDYFPEENTANVAVDIIRRKFPSVPCENVDISIAHRVPSKRKENGRPKAMNIYVKLVRRDVKKKLVAASRDQAKNRANNKTFINESLTPQRSTVFHALKDMRKKHPDKIKGVTTIEGQVHCFTPRDGQDTSAARPQDAANRRLRNDVRHVINSQEDLQTFCEVYIKKPLEDFVSNWPSL